jgi:hypothetical protein
MTSGDFVEISTLICHLPILRNGSELGNKINKIKKCYQINIQNDTDKVYQHRKDDISELEGVTISLNDIKEAFKQHKTRKYDSMSCNHLRNGLNESTNKLIYKLFNLIMI